MSLRVGEGPRWRLPGPGTFRLLRTRPREEWFLIGSLLLLIAFCILLYFVYVEPWINGGPEVRIGADSDRYWQSARLRQEGARTDELVSLTGNFLGPVALAILFGNGFWVLCFNVLLLYLAFKIAGSIPHLDKAKFGFLVLLCMELLPTIATLNKEIFTLFAAVVTAKYLYTEGRPKRLLFAALATSVFARWEMALALLLSLGLSRGALGKRPKTALALLILAITVAYPLAFKILGIDTSIFDWVLAGARTIVLLDNIQMHFGFPLVVLPKILMQITGQLGQPAFFFGGFWFDNFAHDPQQALFQPAGCVAYLVVGFLLFHTGKADLRRPVVFLSAVTLIITAASPFVQSRYLYGVYIMLCLELARPAAAGAVRPFEPAAARASLPAVATSGV